MLHNLSRLAEVHNVAVVITNQVQSQPDDFSGGDGLRATGGNVMGHGSTYRIHLRKAGKTRIAIMIDSPYHAYDQTKFKVPQFKDQFYSYLLWPLLVAISIVIITFPQIYNKLFRTFRRDQIIFLTGIVEEIMMIRNIMKKNPLTTSNFPEKWTSISYETKRQIVGNISDYLLIDDFYTLLTKRNTYVINNKIENNKLNQYIEKCIQFSEKALSGVDWKKYRITGRISRPQN